MGKINEIQESATQSYGSNGFTTTIKEDTVEFDSIKDNFTFKDTVEINENLVVDGTIEAEYMSADEIVVDTLTVAGQPVVPGGSQPDWNQNDETQPDYIKNRICYTDEQKDIIIEGVFPADGATFRFSDTTSGDLNPEISYTFQIGDDTYDTVLYGSTGSCGGGGYITNGTYSVQNSDGVISLVVEGDPSYYSGKNIQLYSGGVIYHQIPSEYIDLKKNEMESNINSNTFGELFTIYHNKFNWSVNDLGYSVSQLNLVVTDSMKDGNTYIFEGVFTLKNAQLPITGDSVTIKINGNYGIINVSDINVIISDNTVTSDNANVMFRIAYAYKYNMDNINVLLIGHKA